MKKITFIARPVFRSVKKMLSNHKKVTAVVVAAAVLLTAGVIEVISPLSPLKQVHSESLLKTPSQDGSGEALAPQEVGAAALSGGKLSNINVKLPKSSNEADTSKPKHQLLVRVDTSDAKQDGGLNIAENNDWNVSSRDTQDFAYKYSKGSDSFTALVNVSNDNKLVALASSDVKVKLTAFAAFSDVEKAPEKPTIVSQDEQQLYQALDIKPSSSDLTSAKGKLAPGGVKTITPFVMYDNQNGIGANLVSQNYFSPLGKGSIPYSTRGDLYPVRAVMLTVQATNTNVTIDGNVIESNTNKMVIAKVDESGYIQFASSNPRGLVKITASGYIGASFESESQTVVEGGVVVLGSNASSQSTQPIENVVGGSILSSFDEPDANYHPNVTIDNVGDIKLGENVSHKLTGTVEAGPALQNVTIYANSQFITTANIDQTVSPARWFATISVGVGSAEISAVANTYDGENQAASTYANGYGAPDSTTSMVSEDTYTVSGDQLNRISQESENYITFAGGEDILVEELDNLGNPVKDPSTNKPEMHVVAPGDIVVLGTDSTKVSGGNSRRVVAVDRFPSKLVLTVTLPSLDEQFLQLNINQNKALDKNDMKPYFGGGKEDENGVIQQSRDIEVSPEEFEEAKKEQNSSDYEKLKQESENDKPTMEKFETATDMANANIDPSKREYSGSAFTEEELRMSEILENAANAVKEGKDPYAAENAPKAPKFGFEFQFYLYNFCANSRFSLYPTAKTADGNAGFSGRVEVRVQACAYAYATFEFGLKFNFSWSSEHKGVIFHFKAGITLYETRNLNIRASLNIFKKMPELSFFDLTKDFIETIGAVPVLITLKFKQGVRPALNVYGEGGVGATLTKVNRYWYQYDTGSPNNGRKADEKEYRGQPFVKGQFSVGLHFDIFMSFEVGVYKMFAFVITVNPYINLELQFYTKSKPKANTDCTSVGPPCNQLEIQIKMVFEFGVRISGTIEIRLWEYFQIRIDLLYIYLGPWSQNIIPWDLFFEVKPDAWSNVWMHSPVPTPDSTDPATPAYTGPGSVYSFGDNSNGQFGNGKTGSNAYTLEPTLGMEKIKKIVSSSYSGVTYAIDSSGNLYSWGDNSKGYLGRGFTGADDSADSGGGDSSNKKAHRPANTPDKVVDSDGSPISGIVDVAATETGGYALTEEGSVYSWGANSSGQLCNYPSSPDKSTNYAEAVSQLDAIDKIAAGNLTGYFVRHDGSLWTCGKSIDQAVGESYWTPTRLGSWSNANGQTMDLIAAGENNFYYTSNQDNKLYGFGKNDGVNFAKSDPYISANSPQVIKGALVPDDNWSYSALSASGGTGYILTSYGKVYAWGANNFGQIGNGLQSYSPVGITEWKTDKKAVTISAGAGYAIASLDSGEVMTWGNNDRLQLGQKKSIAVNPTPTLIDATQVSHVAAGGETSYIVKQIGNVPSVSGDVNQALYGDDGNASLQNHGDYGISAKKTVSNSLGNFILADDGSVRKISSDGLSISTINNDNNEINKIIDIAGSLDSMFALGEDGAIFSWSDNQKSVTLGRAAKDAKDAAMPKALNLADDGSVKRCGSEDKAFAAGISAFDNRAFAICEIQGAASKDNPGKAVAWGDNTEQSLGISADAVGIVEPEFVDTMNFEDGHIFDPIAVTAGRNATLFISKDGALCAVAKQDGKSSDFVYPAIHYFAPDKGNGIVKSITASTGGFYFVTDKGQIFSAGWSVNTGSETGKSQTNPALVSGLENDYILSAAALKTQDSVKNDTIFALTDDNQVIMFGQNLKQYPEFAPPSYFLSILNAVSVWAGNGSIYVITGQAALPTRPNHSLNLYSAGKNDKKQLGLGTAFSQTALALSDAAGKKVAEAVASESAGYVLTADGLVLSFGDNSYGQRGVGDASSHHDVATQVSGISHIVSISASGNAAFALDDNGDVYAWGELASGSYLVPQKLNQIANIKSINAVANLLYMVKANGAVCTWDTNISNSPQIIPNLKHVIKISANKSGALVLQEPSLVDTNSDSSDSSSTPKNKVSYYSANAKLVTPIDMPVDEKGEIVNILDVAVSINSGSGEDASTYYMYDDKGNLYSWGSNIYHQANPANQASQIPDPTVVPFNSRGDKIQDIKAGDKVVYIVDDSGDLSAFGVNTNGELAQGSQEPVTDVAKVYDYGLEALGTGSGVVFALGRKPVENDPAGKIYALGDNTNGTLGVPMPQSGTNVTQFTPLNSSPNDSGGADVQASFTKVVTNGSTTIALDSSGRVWQWGKDFDSQSVSNYPVRLSQIKSVSDISIGANSAYVLKSDKTVWSWGLNNLGQLGINDSNIKSLSKDAPHIVWGLFNIEKIAAGLDSAYAQKSDGTFYSWGGNDYFQLGLGDYKTAPYYITPQTVDALQGLGIKEIVGGAKTGYILTDSGQVWSWGKGDRGERGDGSVTEKTSTPVEINITPGSKQDKKVYGVHLSASDSSAYVLGSDGWIYAWGENDKNQLGTIDGQAPVSDAFKTVSENSFVQGKPSLLAAGKNSAYLLNDDKTVAGYGGNDAHQFPGSAASYPTEQKLVKSYPDDPVALFAGRNQIYIIVPIEPQSGDDTNIWGVGANDQNQLGRGATSAAKFDIATVKAVDAAKGVQAVSVANAYSTGAAALNDGRVATWGNSSNGLLGRNQTTGTSALADFVIPPAGGQAYLTTRDALCSTALCEVADIVGTDTAFYALTRGGAVYVWGNNNGQVNSVPVLAIPGADGADRINTIKSEGDRIIAYRKADGTEPDDSVINSIYAWTRTGAPQKIVIDQANNFEVEDAFVSGNAYYTTGTTKNDSGTVKKAVYTWGSNANCSLADATNCTLGSGHAEVTPFQPTMLSRSGIEIVDVALVDGENWILDKDNRIWKWSSAPGNFEPLIKEADTVSGNKIHSAKNSSGANWQFIYNRCNDNSCNPTQVYDRGNNQYGQLATDNSASQDSWAAPAQLASNIAVTSLASGGSGFTTAVGVDPIPPTIGNTNKDLAFTAGDEVDINLQVQAAPYPSTKDLTFEYSGISSLSDLGLEAKCSPQEGCSITGTITGKPGVYGFTATVTTELGSVSQQYEIVLDGQAPTLNIIPSDVKSSYNIGEEVDIPIYTVGIPDPKVTGDVLPPGLSVTEIRSQDDLDNGIRYRLVGQISSSADSKYETVLKATNAVLPDGVTAGITFNITKNPLFNIPCENIADEGQTRCVIKIAKYANIDIDLGLSANPSPTLVTVGPKTTLDTLKLNVNHRYGAPDVQTADSSPISASHWYLTSNGVSENYSGKYELTASADGAAQTTFWLYIDNEKPHITSDTSYSSIVGSQINFPVNIEGVPYPDLYTKGYSKNGTKISDNAWPAFLHFAIADNYNQAALEQKPGIVITSPALTKDMIGNYDVCIGAKNAVGDFSLCVSIIITGSDPAIAMDDQQFFFDDSGDSQPAFDFTMSGSPAPVADLKSVTFKAGGSTDEIPTDLFKLDDGPTGAGPFSIFATRKLTDADIGVYKVHLAATSPMGSADKTVTIGILQKAQFNISGITEYNVGQQAVLNLGLTGNPCPQDVTFELPSGAGFTGSIEGAGQCQAGVLFKTSALQNAGSYQIKFIATQHTGSVQNQIVGYATIDVLPDAPQIKVNPNIYIQDGTSFSELVQITGSPCPQDVKLENAPDWLTIEKNSTNSWCGGAVLKGTVPSSTLLGAAFNVRILAKNSSGEEGFASTTLQILGAEPAFHIASSTNATVGRYFDLDLGVTGNPFPSVSVQPLINGGQFELPNGLVLYKDSAAQRWFIRGIPTAAGEYSFSLAAVNNALYDKTGKNSTAHVQLKIIVSGSYPTINPVGSKNFISGESVRMPLGVTGSPCPTVELDENSRKISGIGITGNCNDGFYLSGIISRAIQSGVYDLRIKATNSQGSAVYVLGLNVVGPDLAPTMTDKTKYTVMQTRLASINLEVKGSPCPNVFLEDASKMPDGMYLVPDANCSDPYGVRFEGVPTTPGIYTVKVIAQNEAGTTTREIIIEVKEYQKEPVFHSATSAIAAENDFFEFNLEITADPAAIVKLDSASDKLPNGLHIVNNSDGSSFISGTPETGTAGTYNIILSASNGVGKPVTHTVTLVVTFDTTMPAFHLQSTNYTPNLGDHFSIPLLVSGLPCPQVTAEIIDPKSDASVSGLTVIGSCLADGFFLEGDAVKLGKSVIRLTAQNPNDPTQKAVQDINIIVSGSDPNLIVDDTVYSPSGDYINIPISVIGDPIPSVTAATLPDGLILSGSDRDWHITGTLTKIGVYSFTLTATGADGKSVQKRVTLNIVDTDLHFNMPSSDNAVWGGYYYLPFDLVGSPCPDSVTVEGDLPDGIHITGGCTAQPYAFSGIPQFDSANAKTDYSVKITAKHTAGGKEAVQDFTLHMRSETPAFYSADQAVFTIGDFSVFDLDVGGSPNPTVSIEQGTLPDGLSLQIIDPVADDVAIVGTPTQKKPSKVVVKLIAKNPNDSSVYAEKTLTINVVGAAPNFAIDENVSVGVNTQFEYPLGLTGDPCPASVQYNANKLPPGVTISGSNCLDDPYKVSGSISQLGNWEIPLTASNTAGVAKTNLVIHSVGAVPEIHANSNATAVENQLFSIDLAIYGDPCPSVSFTSSRYTGDMKIEKASDGSCNFSLTGHIAEAGTYQVNIRAANEAGFAEKSILLHIGGTRPEFHLDPNISVEDNAKIKIPLNVTGDPSPTASLGEIKLVNPVTGPALPTKLNVEKIGDNWYLTGALDDNLLNGFDSATYSITLNAENGDTDADKNSFVLMFTVTKQNATFNVPDTVYITKDNYYELPLGLSDYDVRVKDGSSLPNGLTLEKQTSASAIHKGWLIYGTPDNVEQTLTQLELVSNGAVVDAASITFNIIYSDVPQFNPTGKTSVFNTELINIALGVVGYPAPDVRVVNTLPDGLQLLRNVGGEWSLAGQISKAGKYSVLLEACSVDDGVKNCTDEKIDITVSDGAPKFNVDNHIYLTQGIEKIVDLGLIGNPSPALNIDSGKLPAGLSIYSDPLNGVYQIKGVPSSVEETTVVLKAVSGDISTTQTLTFTVSSSEPDFFLPAQSVATLGEYSYIPIVVSGSPCPAVELDQLSDALPSGLTLKGGCLPEGGSDYRITGTVNQDAPLGDYNIVLKASNVGFTKTASFQIKVVPEEPSFMYGASAHSIFIKDKYSAFDLGVAGSPYPNVTLESGTLPQGLTLVNDSDNRKSFIEGSPTSAAAEFSRVILKALDPINGQFATLELTIQIVDDSPHITFQSGQALPIVYVDYNEQSTISFSVSGHPLPDVKMVGNLPAGFALMGQGSSTYSISGKSSAAGIYPITLTAINEFGSQTLTFNLVVKGANPEFKANPVVDLTVDAAADIDLGVTSCPYKSQVAIVDSDGYPLPPGLQLKEVPSASGETVCGDSNPNSPTAPIVLNKWVITGKPTLLGSFNNTFKACSVDSADNILDSLCTVYSMEINVLPSAPKFNVEKNGSGELVLALTSGTSVNYDLRITGNPIPGLSVLSGKLPKGLSLDKSGFLQGIISDNVGDYKLEILAQNSSGQTDTLQLVIHVVHQIPGFHPLSTDIYGTLGQVVDIDLGVTGSPLPNVIVKDGQLPTGISLMQENNSWYLRGQLQGDPGEFNFELQAVSPLTQTRANAAPVSASYAQDAFDFKVNAVKPTFKLGQNNKIPVKQFEYVNIPLRLVAHPCADPEAENLPEGLALRGNCETGFSASGVITARPGVYKADMSAANVAGSSQEELQIVVNPNVVPAPPNNNNPSSGDQNYSGLAGLDASAGSNPNLGEQANPGDKMQPNDSNQNSDNSLHSGVVSHIILPIAFLMSILLLAVYMFIRRKEVAAFIGKVVKRVK